MIKFVPARVSKLKPDPYHHSSGLFVWQNLQILLAIFELLPLLIMLPNLFSNHFTVAWLMSFTTLWWLKFIVMSYCVALVLHALFHLQIWLKIEYFLWKFAVTVKSIAGCLCTSYLSFPFLPVKSINSVVLSVYIMKILEKWAMTSEECHNACDWTKLLPLLYWETDQILAYMKYCMYLPVTADSDWNWVSPPGPRISGTHCSTSSRVNW